YPFERLFITINCLLSKRAIGIAGFTLHSDGSGKAIEFGVMLIPDYQGQGIAASITLNAVNWIFSSLNIQRVIVEIDGLNIAARKTAEKVGFQPSENDPRFYILTANY
ncbi:GNAT family protein, partial [Chromatiaceae bacterium AAb-1]|nr:GNAT family protein [Chromatiaceae bacterium AAb-1]